MASQVKAIQEYSFAATGLASNKEVKDTFTLLAQLTGLVREAEGASALYSKKDLQNPSLAEWRLAAQTTANLAESAKAAECEHAMRSESPTTAAGVFSSETSPQQESEESARPVFFK